MTKKYKQGLSYLTIFILFISITVPNIFLSNVPTYAETFDNIEIIHEERSEQLEADAGEDSETLEEAFIETINNLEQPVREEVYKPNKKVYFNFEIMSLGEEVVTFQDNNLEQAIRDALNKPDGDITRADMETITNLDVSNSGIQYLSGLEYAVNLQTLSFAFNQVSDISALANLTNMMFLYFYNNQVSNISVLANLTNLWSLNFYNNQVSDISALAGLTNLRSLSFNNNQVKDISALGNLVNLQDLDFSDNQVIDISATANLTNLQNFIIKNNYINITEGSAARQIIEAHLNRGANVEYTPQNISYTNWNENMVLGQNGPYPFAGIYEFDNLFIGDNVEITSSGISQLIIRLTGPSNWAKMPLSASGTAIIRKRLKITYHC